MLGTLFLTHAVAIALAQDADRTWRHTRESRQSRG